MSNKNKEKDKKAEPKNHNKAPLKITEKLAPGKVKMKFSEHKYYNDLNKPLFMAGEVYELEGADWIQRWVKRGGEIVEGKLEFAPQVVNESVLVSNKEKEEAVVEDEKVEDQKAEDKE